MEGEQGESLRDVLERIHFLYQQDIDFTATTPDVVLEIVRRLTAAAFYFILVAITDFGGRSGRERTPGLVENVVGAAFQTFAGQDPHPEPFQKAAMLLRGITQGHPFADGNKRTGFYTAMYYLAQLGFPAPADLPADEVVQFCLDVSAGRIRDVEAIANQLRRFWRQPSPSA